MKHLLTLLCLCFLSESCIGNDTDEAEAILRLIAARRQQSKPHEIPLAPSPSQPVGWHYEKGTDGTDYWVKDGYTIQKSSGVISHPFLLGAGTQATSAPSVVGASLLSIATTGTGRTITGALTMGRYGVTNCPPSG